MKKLKFVTIFALTIFMFSNFQIQGQTLSYLSGTGTNNANPAAGTVGANCTFIGSGAGFSNGVSGYRNTFLGNGAGYNNNPLSDNVGVGYAALYTQSGSVSTWSTHNVAVGNWSLFSSASTGSSNGIKNTAVGDSSLYSNVLGYNNTAVGFQALTSAAGNNDIDITAVGYRALANANGTLNGGLTAVGSEALMSIGNNTRSQSTAVGYHALRLNQGTGPCTAVGSNALQDNDGEGNTAVGSEATYYNLLGDYNSVFGNAAGRGTVNNSYSHNTFLGNESGRNISTGSYNTFSGSQSGNSNTTGEYNVFSGYQAGYSNTSAQYNTLIGYRSGYNNNTPYNTFIGGNCGYSNTSGSYNAFLGYFSGYYNTTGGRNTFSGYQSAYNNTTGGNNTAFGYRALYSNTTTSYNTAVGYSALGGTSAANNTAIGYQAGNNNTTGTYNTFLGQATGGANNTTGTYNTFVGYGAIANGNYTNATAIGNGAIVNSSNKVRVGDATVGSVYETQYAWTTPSDARFKYDVKEEVKGLEFINKLRPVTYRFYTRNFQEFLTKNMPDSIKAIYMNSINYAQSGSIIQTGFIAQEVEQAAQDAGYSFDGIHIPADSSDNYSLAYSQFVVPIIKAIQEQQSMIDSLRTTIGILTSNTKSMHVPNNEGNEDKTGNKKDIKLTLPDAAILGDAQPNPNDGNTQIPYYLPENISYARIIFTDMFGKVMQETTLETGYGLLNIDTQDLPNGIYSYSLVVNGKMLDNKKMIRNK